MPDNLILSLGGISIGLVPDTRSGIYSYSKSINDFLVDANPEITLGIHCGNIPIIDEDRKIFETDVSWRMFDLQEKVAIKVNLDKTLMLGVFPTDFHSGDIYVASLNEDAGEYLFPFNSPMGELFMMNFLGDGQGVIFHSTAVIYEGKGYLFAGYGSAGKSTTARMWQTFPGAIVVNDDKVIVRKGENKFLLYGTPWHGQGGMALPDAAPIEKIFVLKQDKRNFATPLSSTQAVSMLFARSFLPLWDQARVSSTLTFIERLTASVPCFELGFLPEKSMIDYVLNFD